MVETTGSRGLRTRWYAFAAAAGFAAAGSAAMIAGTPAVAQEPLTHAAFETAFAPFDLTPSDTQSSAEMASAAELRFAQAPVAEFSQGSLIGTGKASYYGSELSGRRTASGERFDPTALTAAHRTLPFGTRVLVTNTGNGRSVVVRINDRGPFHGNRMIDLSREAARQIGLISRGSGQVRVAAITS